MYLLVNKNKGLRMTNVNIKFELNINFALKL